MVSIERISPNSILIKVDTAIYNDTVISKTLYWHSESFVILRENCGNGMQSITFTKKDDSIIPDNELLKIRYKLSQDFADFKNRDIINAETKNIRDILFIKAFANNDDFEAYNLIDE